LKFRLDGLKGDDSAPIPAGAEGFTELADVRANIDHNVNLAIFDEIKKISYSPPAEVNDSKTFIYGSYNAIHLSTLFCCSLCVRHWVRKTDKDAAAKERQRPVEPSQPLLWSFQNSYGRNRGPMPFRASNCFKSD
jgi:hypothetical protein